MADNERFFRAAGYLFTWASAGERLEAVEMWRESADGHERFWVTRARCRPNREGAYSAAMAMLAWVKSLDVPVRRDPKAQAVLEQLAVTHDRLRNLPPHSDLAMTAALHTLVSRRVAAA